APCELQTVRASDSSSCSLFAADAACLPFETDHRTDPSRMVLAALAGQRANEGAIVQLLLRPAPSKARKRALAQARKSSDGTPRSSSQASPHSTVRPNSVAGTSRVSGRAFARGFCHLDRGSC